MPKRIPTPPPADDEPRYLTVVHPYAISGTCNMELPKDRQDFARWVACCIDKDAFFAFFHKPSSRGMVIIEISRSYAHFDRVLGEHRWSEFLQTPSEEERGRLTQVFYCSYNTGRIVQKNGWKRIDVDEAWFKDWSPRNRQIKFPYPQTHFCDVPIEDRTNYPLCRPLPGAVIAPPKVEIAAPQPVVGSAAWIHGKDTATETKSKVLGAWGKGAPKPQTIVAKPNAPASGNVKRTAGVPQVPSAIARLPAVGGGSIAVKSNNVWQNTGAKPAPLPVAMNWEESPPVSRQNTPGLSTNQTLTGLPGLPAPYNAGESGAISCPPHLPSLAVPGKTAVSTQCAPLSTASWGSNDASTPSQDSNSLPTTATESDNPHAIYINFSESMEEEFHGMGIRALEDDSELQELDSVAPNWDATAANATWDMYDAWDDNPLDAEDLWRQNQEQEKVKPMLCSAHGIICKKGICAEYARQVRLAKRADEEDKRRAAMKNKGKKGGRSKGRGAGKKNDENEPNERNEGQNNQFRGSGAPVRTNWRGAPRAIVSADAVEKRDTNDAVSDDGCGNSDWEEPKAAAVVSDAPNAASDASWSVPENAFDPWATTTEQSTAKAKHSNAKPRDKKKPVQTTISSSWADQVDAELAATGNVNTSMTVSSKRKSKRGGNSTTSWGTSKATSSTSGWGTVSDMP